ncbi:MAG: hypothetical protein NUV63_09445, partial [Gallionella sp.]|nr:hypothetical protein [Gallionella sp.]
GEGWGGGRSLVSPLLYPLDETTSHSTRLQKTAAKSLVNPNLPPPRGKGQVIGAHPPRLSFTSSRNAIATRAGIYPAVYFVQSLRISKTQDLIVSTW